MAVLCYTSGTIGVPKGAMCTHGNMAFNSQTYRDWMGFTSGDSVLGVAPLFHITGLIGHVGIALLEPCPLVINHRFEPGVVMDAIREHKPTFTAAWCHAGGRHGACASSRHDRGRNRHGRGGNRGHDRGRTATTAAAAETADRGRSGRRRDRNRHDRD